MMHWVHSAGMKPSSELVYVSCPTDIAPSLSCFLVPAEAQAFDGPVPETINGGCLAYGLQSALVFFVLASPHLITTVLCQ